MKIETISKSEIPETPGRGRKRGPLSLAVLALTPRKAFRMTVKSKDEAGYLQRRIHNIASLNGLYVGVRTNSTTVYAFLKS